MNLKLGFFLALVLMGAVSFFGFRWLVGGHNQMASGEVLTVQGDCRLDQAPCEATDEQERRVTISLMPTPLPLMKPITTRVELQGFENVLSTRFQVEGVNMFMGYQQAALTPSTQSGAVTGSFMLPVCSNEIMHWKGTLHIQTRDALFQTSFPFTTTTATALQTPER